MQTPRSLPLAIARPPEMFAAVMFILMYSNLLNYVNATYDQSIKPLYFYLVVYVVAIAMLAGGGSRANGLARSYVAVGLLLFQLVMVAAQTLFFQAGDAAIDAITGRAHFVFSTIAALIILGSCSRLDKLRMVLGGVILATSVFNVFELFYFGEQFGWLSKVAGRAAGMFVDPNDSAMFISIGLPAVLIGQSIREKVAVYTITLLGVLATFSRGGLITWIAALIVAEIFSARVKIASFSFALPVASVAALAGIVFLFNSQIVDTIRAVLGSNIDSDISARLDMVDTASADERIQLLRDGWAAFEEAPIFGRGLGYTFEWAQGVSVHNVFLRVLVEQGIVGGIWLVLLLAALWRYSRPYGAGFVLLFCVSGMFAHNHLERPAVGILMALYMTLRRGDEKVPVPTAGTRVPARAHE